VADDPHHPDPLGLLLCANTPVLGVDDILRVFDTCPACTDARALLSLAAPHVTSQLTVLERTVTRKA